MPALAPVTWKLRDVVPVFLMPLGLTLFVASLLEQVIHPKSAVFITIVFYLQEIATGAAVVFWLRAIRKSTLEPLGLRSSRPGRDVGVGIGFGVVTLITAGIVVALTRDVASLIAGHRVTIPDRIPSSITGLWLIPLFPVLVLIGPLAEEMMFRGFSFRAFRTRFRFGPALLFSAALFSIAHVTFLSLPYAFVDGLILGAVYERRRSLVATFTAHAVNNLAGFIGLLLLRH